MGIVRTTGTSALMHASRQTVHARTGEATEALGRQGREEDMLEEARQPDLVLHAQPLRPLPDVDHEAVGW